MSKGLNIILMGPPAAGKGTQSEFICSKYGIKHISTGDMFRQAIAEKTKLGVEAEGYISKGLLVPDDVTIGLVAERLAKDDCKEGFLLDGFPRTIPQADKLNEILSSLGRSLSVCIALVADEEKLVERISSRRVCPKCGASYSLITKKPKVEGICDLCGSEIIQRKDDCAESFKVRLDDYSKKTYPLISYYSDKGLLKEVDALMSIEDVSKAISVILDEVK